MRGKIYTTVSIRKDRINKYGTSSIYIMIRVNQKSKKLFTGVSVSLKSFDSSKGRVKGKSQTAKDFNLIIEKLLSDINKIEVEYRLSGSYLDLDTLIKELTNPTPKFDFIKFWEMQMEVQKKILKNSTYNQQMSSLRKLKKWKKVIPFSIINDTFIPEIEVWCKKKLGNENTTVSTLIKNIKKYLHLANKQGIKTPLTYDDIKVTRYQGKRTFLLKEDIQLLYDYWDSKFIKISHKLVLSKFLFSCFTSLRISDIQKITQENIVDNTLFYSSTKTEKLNRIKIPKKAFQFINTETKHLFNDEYTPQTINELLKEICIILDIKKNVTFHVARHSFATNYIIRGGNVVNLQKLMDHSDIKETMIYVHIIDSVMDEEIDIMDDLLN
ncbi:MAG: site-specific integrase [Flavobacteriaceae bacterium]|nr:site-specific integrase [Flavobacteriaceae bacterium]